MNKRRETEKWVILVISCLVTASSMGISNAKGVFIGPLCDEIGMTRAQYGVASTICTVVSCLAGMVMPRVLDRLGVKRTIMLGCFSTAAAYALMGVADSFVMYTCCNAATGFGYSFFSSSLIFLVVDRWFGGNGGATGIVASSSGISGALLSPVFAAIVEAIGLRRTLFVVAAVALVLCFPALFYKRNLFPAEEEKDTSRPEDISAPVVAYKRKASVIEVILLSLTYSIPSLTLAFAQYMSGVAVTRGHSAESGALMVSALMAGNVFWKLIGGVMSDKFGASQTNVFMYMVNIASIVLMLSCDSMPMLLVSAFLFGTIYAAIGLIASLVANQLFGMDGYRDNYPSMLLSYTILYSLLSPIVGKMYDVSGSYDAVMGLTIIVSIVTSVLHILLLIMKKKADKKLSEMQ